MIDVWLFLLIKCSTFTFLSMWDLKFTLVSQHNSYFFLSNHSIKCESIYYAPPQPEALSSTCLYRFERHIYLIMGTSMEHTTWPLCREDFWHKESVIYLNHDSDTTIESSRWRIIHIKSNAHLKVKDSLKQVRETPHIHQKP